MTRVSALSVATACCAAADASVRRADRRSLHHVPRVSTGPISPKASTVALRSATERAAPRTSGSTIPRIESLGGGVGVGAGGYSIGGRGVRWRLGGGGVRTRCPTPSGRVAAGMPEGVRTVKTELPQDNSAPIGIVSWA